MPTRQTDLTTDFTDANTIKGIETSIDRISLSVIRIDGALDMPLPDRQAILQTARSIKREARRVEKLLEPSRN